jgi:alpha-L-arabinofuranosidase
MKMKKYKLSADAVPEFEAIVATEEQAVAIHAMLTALTNYRRNLHGNDAYITYHNREKEDLKDSFDSWAEGCDMIWTEVIEVE